MHWYSEIRADYYAQLTNEVLAPHPRNPSKMVWQILSGRRNEALDCEVYALHAARSLKTHLLRGPSGISSSSSSCSPPCLPVPTNP